MTLLIVLPWCAHINTGRMLKILRNIYALSLLCCTTLNPNLRIKPCHPGYQNIVQKTCEKIYSSNKGEILSVFLMTAIALMYCYLSRLIAKNASRPPSMKTAPWTYKRDSESLVICQFSRMPSKQGNLFKLYKLSRSYNFTLKRSENSISSCPVNCFHVKKSYQFIKESLLLLSLFQSWQLEVMVPPQTPQNSVPLTCHLSFNAFLHNSIIIYGKLCNLKAKFQNCRTLD